MKAELFSKLVAALDEAVACHWGAKLDLRTTVLPEKPEPLSSNPCALGDGDVVRDDGERFGQVRRGPP